MTEVLLCSSNTVVYLASCTSKTLTPNCSAPCSVEILQPPVCRMGTTELSLLHLYNSDTLEESTSDLSRVIDHFPLNRVVSPWQQIPAMGQQMLPHRFNPSFQTAQAQPP